MLLESKCHLEYERDLKDKHQNHLQDQFRLEPAEILKGISMETLYEQWLVPVPRAAS